jgi:hypothetical protein
MDGLSGRADRDQARQAGLSPTSPLRQAGRKHAATTEPQSDHQALQALRGWMTKKTKDGGGKATRHPRLATPWASNLIPSPDVTIKASTLVLGLRLFGRSMKPKYAASMRHLASDPRTQS